MRTTETTSRFAKGETLSLSGSAVTASADGTLHTFASAAGTTHAMVLDTLPQMLRAGLIRTALVVHG